MDVKKHIVCLLVCSAFAVSACGETAFGQTAVKAPAPTLQLQTVKSAQAEALRLYNPGVFAEVQKYANWMTALDANAATGEVWAVYMYGSPGCLSNNDSHIGFRSSSIKNPGTTDWTGVNITATFQVLSLAGSATSLSVSWYQKVGDHWPGVSGNTGWKGVLSPGTYVVTTPPFTMKPGAEYCGFADVVLTAHPAPNQAHGCYAKITSIKFNFP
jgi:hypothetical protein